jgi:phosphate transport system substrate-binding protein
MTLHLKRMICVGAAVFGVTASTAIASASATSIPEAGSSLVYPLVSIWQNHYTAATIAPGAGGSSTGIADIQANSVDIGASDAPMTSSQYSADSHGPVEIPWALYAKALKKAGSITPVFRSDGSGDSFAFQNFLLKGAPKYWKTPPSTAFAGTVGQGENGNAGVAGEVHSNKGTIGYISAAYLIQQNIHVAEIENAAGNFELPNASNIANAAASDSTIPAQGSAFTSGLGVPIQYPSKKYKTAYPVSTYTYAIVNTSGTPKSGSTSDIQAFLTWATTTGQAYGGTLDFVPLPSRIRSADASIISSI